MAAAVASTTGFLGMWNGTKDGKTDGYMDWNSGSTNVADPLEVKIVAQDIRTMSPQPNYNNNGYGIVKHKSSLTPEQFLAGNDPEGKLSCSCLSRLIHHRGNCAAYLHRFFPGKKYVEDVYFKEVAELVKQVTGSDVVVPYVFRIRQNSVNPGGFATSKLSHAALPIAHVDRDDVTGEDGVREILGDVADELIKQGKRYAQVNVWRTIDQPIQKWPLCFINHDDIKDWAYDTHLARVYPANDPRIAIRGEKRHDSVVKFNPK